MAKAHFVVILCGGTGPRLWPLSRAEHPKQFLKLFGAQSLLQQTYSRAKKVVSSKHIFFVTNQKQADKLKKQIPQANIIIEPQKKNTMLAILYANAVIKKIHPQAIVSFFPSDHFITNLAIFKNDMAKAYQLASQTDSIILFGITPNSPDLSYGYILADNGQVKKFIEKPDLKNATKLISQKALWNSGIYTLSVSTLESETAKAHPEYFKLYQRLLSSHPNVNRIYQLSPNLSIDRAISETSNKLLVVKAKFDWNDIGEWKSIYQQLPKTDQAFAVLNHSQFHQVNSGSCLISSNPKKLIGLVGVKDLAIIDTPDALLVCNIANDDSYNVRDLVTKIVTNPRTKKYFLKSSHER